MSPGKNAAPCRRAARGATIRSAVAASPHHLPVLALGTCLLAGCFAPPERGDQSPPARVARVLDADWSVAGWNSRCEAFARSWAALGSELQRVERLPGRTAELASGSPSALGAVPARAEAALASELARLEHLSVPATLRPNPEAWAQQTATALAVLPYLLGFDRRPLGEPSDREHRTDLHDERPEATVWQRIARRLPLFPGL